MDQKQAFEWFKRAADANHAQGLVGTATCYLDGKGVARDTARGLILLGQAAALGSEHACYLIGWGHYHGRFTLGKDDAETSRWFRRMPSCRSKDSSDVCRDDPVVLRAATR